MELPELAQQALIAVAAIVLPGTLVNWISGLRLPWAAAAGIPTTMGIVGFSGWVLSQLDIPFNLSTVTRAYWVFVAAALLWRMPFLTVWALGWWKARTAQTAPQPPPDEEELDDAGKLEAAEAAGAEAADVEAPEEAEDDKAEEETAEPQAAASTSEPKRWWQQPIFRNGGLTDPRWILPLAGVITGAWVYIARIIELYEGLKRDFSSIVQGWDVHWHASEVRFILEEGIADSTRMGEAHNLDGHAPLFYPSGWHAVTALLAQYQDLTAIEAINWMNIILPSVAIPLSVALIAWRLVGNRGLAAQIAAGFAAAIVIATPVLYWIPTYVGMWPYLGSISMTGIVAALIMSIPALPIRIFAGIIGFMGVVIMHPAPVTVVVFMVGFWWLFYQVWRPVKKPTHSNKWIGGTLVRLRDLGLLFATGGIAMVLLWPQLKSGFGQSEDVQSVTAFEDISRGESFEKTILMRTRHVGEFGLTDWTYLLWFAGIGAVVLLVWRRNIWAPLFVVFSGLLTMNALTVFPDPWGGLLSMIGGLHYGTAHRLVIPVAMFLFAYCGVGVAVVIRIVFAGFVKHKTWRVASVCLSTIAAIWITYLIVPWAVSSVEDGSKWAIQSIYDERMVTKDDLKAFDWLAKQPHAYDAHIFGEHADGYGWMYAYNGLPAVSRHYEWPTLPANAPTHVLHNSSYLIGAGNHGDPDQRNKADEAIDKLDVNFIVLSPPNFWWFQHTNLEMGVKIDQAPGLTMVYKKNSLRIFAVNSKFTDAELNQMRNSKGSPDPLPPGPRCTKNTTDAESEDTEVEYNEETGEPILVDKRKVCYHRSSKPPKGKGPDITDEDAKERLLDDGVARHEKATLRF